MSSPVKSTRAARVDDAVRDRRIRLVGAVGQQAEDEETDNDDQAGDLQPGAGNQQLTFRGRLLAVRHAGG